MLRWGLLLVAASIVALAALTAYQYRLAGQSTLLDVPLRVVAGRTVTRSFTIPANATYEMNIYVREKVPYADCLLGRGGSVEKRCTRHPRAIDVVWALHGINGSILRHGVSGGTCCTYTSDAQNHRVVSTKLDSFQLPSSTNAYLELRYQRDLGHVMQLDPRLVVEQTSENSEAEGIVDGFAFLAISLTAAVGVLFLVIVALRRLASTPKGETRRRT